MYLLTPTALERVFRVDDKLNLFAVGFKVDCLLVVVVVVSRLCETEFPTVNRVVGLSLFNLFEADDLFCSVINEDDRFIDLNGEFGVLFGVLNF